MKTPIINNSVIKFIDTFGIEFKMDENSGKLIKDFAHSNYKEVLVPFLKG